MRKDKRKNSDLRKITIKPNFLKYAESSVLISQGNTKVICSATLEDKVPPHLRNQGTGWITAEYFMLPRSSHKRSPRQKILHSGRTLEIQRLIGRSLRAVTDLSVLKERTIVIDCDVIQADGGTRTTSISGAFTALCLMLKKLQRQKTISVWPIKHNLAAVSAGIINNIPMLDLCYEEDVNAEVDMNIVMTDKGNFVEIQGTGEKTVFNEEQLKAMLTLAKKGIKEIIEIQKKIIK
ncbi:ribonuclease PH [bacterium]